MCSETSLHRPCNYVAGGIGDLINSGVVPENGIVRVLQVL